MPAAAVTSDTIIIAWPPPPPPVFWLIEVAAFDDGRVMLSLAEPSFAARSIDERRSAALSVVAGFGSSAHVIPGSAVTRNDARTATETNRVRIMVISS